MKEIPIGHGFFALVDDEDFKWLSNWTWRTHWSRGKRQYVCRGEQVDGEYVTFLMHRVIMDALPWMQIDHINGNTFDNRKENLRFCTNQQNNFNKFTKRPSKSGVTGVRYHDDCRKWQARIELNCKEKNLGFFLTKEEAANARRDAVLLHHGKFANILN